MAMNSFHPRIIKRIITQIGIEPEPDTNALLASKNITSASLLIISLSSYFASIEIICISFSKFYIYKTEGQKINILLGKR